MDKSLKDSCGAMPGGCICPGVTQYLQQFRLRVSGRNPPHPIEEEHRCIVAGITRNDDLIEPDPKMAAEPGDRVALVRSFRKDV